MKEKVIKEKFSGVKYSQKMHNLIVSCSSSYSQVWIVYKQQKYKELIFGNWKYKEDL